MYLEKLSIVNYKNIEGAEVALSKRLNCFVGGNGVGKTNLLDAVYFLCCCKSRTNAMDRENIKHDCEYFILQGSFMRAGVPENISVGLKRGRHKSFKRNGKDYQRLQDHIGLLPAVMVSPDDGELISGGSEERRKFVDGVLSQFNPQYLDNLLRYNKLLQQRNSLLKEENMDDDLYEVCELQMAGLAEEIYKSRCGFIERFLPIFGNYYSAICEGKEAVEIRYRSHLADGDLAAQLAAVRERDRIVGYTTKGIHKDDFEMFLNDYPIKRTGSQGQGKTFLVALKLAQYDFLKAASGIKPVLLLDDIFDKLDARRVGKIIDVVSGEDFGQIFITDTNRENIDLLIKGSGADYSLFMVNGGVFEKADEKA